MPTVIAEDSSGAALVAVHQGPGGGLSPLVCVHSAHGNCAFLHRLASKSPGYAIWGLQAPSSLAADATASSLATQYAELLLQASAAGSFRIAGYCAGASIAYELALQLQGRGYQVSFVGLLDVVAPDPLEMSGQLPGEVELAEVRLSELRSALAQFKLGGTHADLVDYLQVTDAVVEDLDPAGLEGYLGRWAWLTRIALAHKPHATDGLPLVLVTPQAPGVSTAGQAEDLKRHWSPFSDEIEVHAVTGAAGMLYRTSGFRELLDSMLNDAAPSPGPRPIARPYG